MAANGETVMGPRKPLDPEALLFILIGASAVGKSALAEGLCEAGIVEATPTWTTRPPRQGERDTCYDHRFVSDEAFDRQTRKEGFIDQHALYGARYGVPFIAAPANGREALMVLKPQFMPVMIEHFPRARIYQVEATTEVLPDRMRARGQSLEDIAARMGQHQAETEAARSFAHVIIDNNGPFELTLDQVQSRIRTDREAYDAQHIPVAAD